MLIFTDRYNLLIRAVEHTPGQSDHASPMITSQIDATKQTPDYPLIVHTACSQEMERLIEDMGLYTNCTSTPTYIRNAREKETSQFTHDNRMGPLAYKTVIERHHLAQLLTNIVQQSVLYQHLPAHINSSSACNNPQTGQPAQERSLRSKAYNYALRAMERLVPLTDKAVP